MVLTARQEAVLLRDDSIGVATENTPRVVQHKNGADTALVTLNTDWLAQLNLAEKGSQTLHSVSHGHKPVIVQNPAIIIQPASVLAEGLDDD